LPPPHALRAAPPQPPATIAAATPAPHPTAPHGSAIGAAIGALIFGMVRQGIVFAGVDADWFQVFLGVMLLIAVLVNHWIRRKALQE
ncbi:MAG: ABC transporter permease, partial [Rhodothermaceae bacterium]|nr:ABC transporter permease [Rhodothermaceae bacterium]